MTTWATVAEVLTITGEDRTQDQIDQAGFVIELWANREFSIADKLKARDRKWLRVATAYQAVWQTEQPGYLTHLTNVTDYNQDGMLTRFDSKVDQSLAPNASRALKNLSWKIARTLRTKDVRLPEGIPNLIDFSQESSDDLHEWTPFPGKGKSE